MSEYIHQMPFKVPVIVSMDLSGRLVTLALCLKPELFW